MPSKVEMHVIAPFQNWNNEINSVVDCPEMGTVQESRTALWGRFSLWSVAPSVSWAGHWTEWGDGHQIMPQNAELVLPFTLLDWCGHLGFFPGATGNKFQFYEDHKSRKQSLEKTPRFLRTKIWFVHHQSTPNGGASKFQANLNRLYK